MGGACPGDDQAQGLAGMETQAGPATLERQLTHPFDGQSITGNYLASQFAQRHHDWGRAERFMEGVLKLSPQDAQLLSKAMVLGMGSGDYASAMQDAHKIVAIEKDNSLALLFLAIEAFHDKKYAEAATYIQTMPEGSLSEFIRPLLKSWSAAASGTMETKDLLTNTIHIHHAILISDFFNKKEEIPALLKMAIAAQALTVEDIERLADGYAHTGDNKTALELYSKALEEWPDNTEILRKKKIIESGKGEAVFKGVKSPEEGVALALADMARLLFHEYSDESARVFANMALYLNPGLTESSLLLASITARNERYEDAIAYYRQVAPDNIHYLDAHREAARLLGDADRTDEALTELEFLFKNYNDLESLIEIGDIYREKEQFDKAVSTYNQVEDKLSDGISKEYWHLHYLRGMSYEQLGQWDKAEADLQKALAFQPDHPFVLNYLGYAWADKGVNLKQSLEMIRKAVALRPEDGFIADSLGWVLYRMGNYAEAVPHLERAVELMPYDSVINDHLGDAYWRVGRQLEARFQWSRAKNHSDDPLLISTIDQKLDQGLQNVDIVKEASSRAGEIEILKP